MEHLNLNDYRGAIAQHLSERRWAAAANAAAQCRAAWPDAADGWLFGSFAAQGAGQPEEALRLVDERLAADRADRACRLQRAESLFMLGRKAEAIEGAVALGHAAGTDAALLDAVGAFLAYASAYRPARDVYDRAIAVAPDDPDLRAKRALLHRFLGDFELARGDYEHVLARNPLDPVALRGRAELGRQTADANGVAAMEAALARAAGDSDDALALHFAVAKSYEDLGDYPACWRHLLAGNGVERGRLQYDVQVDRAVMRRIAAVFPGKEAPAEDTTGERPIFIVGLPRTGTTLTERILSNHSQLHAAGELPALSEAIRVTMETMVRVSDLDWLEFAGLLGRLDSGRLAREYLARASNRRGDKPRFIDKQTINFNYCALILRAFPAASIVHVTRHPLAACYAIFKNRFPRTFPFAYHLDELGEFYLGYRELMAHWHRVLPGRIIDVAYEDLVTSLEPTVRGLLGRLDLPFEPACLEFHRNPAPSMTASSVQVRQPLYDRSLDLWRHYSVQLEPLRVRFEAAGISAS